MATIVEDLTPRQTEVLTLLEEGLQAREIGERIGITRNAVYQVIGALKNKGVLDQAFTPTGTQHVKANDVLAAQEAAGMASGAALDVIRELVAMNRQLVETIAELSKTR